MRLFPAVLSAILVATLSLSIQSRAHADDFDIVRAQARQELAMAKLELRHYLQIEYPRERRYLNAEIKLVQAEIAALRRRDRRCSLFDRYSNAHWTQPAYGDWRLCLLEAELRFQDMLAERNTLARVHAEHWRMLELMVRQARLRVAELEGGTGIVLESSTNVRI